MRGRDRVKALRRRARKMLLTILVSTAAFLLIGFATTLYLSARAERLHPPLGKFVTVEGLRQHYIERGDASAPSIVFVHGAFGAAQDFAVTILDDLARDHHCIAWDRPGHGYSERPTDEVAGPDVQARLLVGLIEELGLDRPLIVGFSYGGAVTLATALDAPDAIRGAVLLNGPSHPWPDPTNLEYRIPAYPVVGAIATSALFSPLGHLLADSSVSRVFSPERVPTAYAKSPVQLSLRPDTYCANAEDIRVLKPYLTAQTGRYANLRVPITMVVSEGDLVVSPTIHSLQLRESAPQFEMIRLEGAGHQILYTQSQLVARTVRDALSK